MVVVLFVFAAGRNCGGKYEYNNAGGIYRLWVAVSALRNCSLGLATFKRGRGQFVVGENCPKSTGAKAIFVLALL